MCRQVTRLTPTLHWAGRAATPKAGSPIHLLALSRPVVLLSYYAGHTTDFRGEAR